jgi:hypothetical protein
VTKKIKVGQHSSADSAEIARFEMSRSLLDPTDQFYFDTVTINEKNSSDCYMSVAYHRDEIDRLVQIYQEKLGQPSGFKLDAVALAAGYRTFCRIDPGELKVLANVETDIVTLAILHHGELYSVGRLETAPGEKISEDAAIKLAAEFRITLDYHLGELYQEGITIPISRIVLSGRHACEDNLIIALMEQFSAEIALPHFHEGYFQPASDTIDRYRPEQFLIPLGLAVE